MLAAFAKIQEAVTWKASKTRTDSTISRLHYRVTTLILLACTTMVCLSDFVGKNIDCIQVDKDKPIPTNVLNTYCFIMSTFTVPEHFGKTPEMGAIYPGIGPYEPEEHETMHHAYYQWVPFVLFFQAMLFYTPHWIWKQMENGKIKNSLKGISATLSLTDEGKETIKGLADAFIAHLGYNQFWGVKFVFCEFLNLVNVIGNIFFTDCFLGGEFSTYGLQVFKFMLEDPEDREDPMNVVFPKMTKCTFHKYGPSGTIQNHDALCVMAQNIINEKIYVFLWFWFVILSILTGLGVIWRIVSICIRPVDSKCSRTLIKPYTKIDVEPEIMAAVNRKCNFGDWLYLHFLGVNMDSISYREFFEQLTYKLNIKSEEDNDNDIRKPMLM